jgi:hypothetical protein
MAIPPPPGTVQKKKGMGCLGCGCLILGLLALLFIALVGGILYVGSSNLTSLTSATPTDVPSFDGGDDVYNATRQKIIDFQHDLKNSQAATLTLSADEINTLIAHSPDIAAAKVRVFVSMSGDQARVQFCAPTDALSGGMLKGRYLTGDVSFGLNFDPAAKTLDMKFQNLQFGNRTIPQNYLPVAEAEVNPALNQTLQKTDDGRNLVNNAKSIEIKDGQLVIETQ